MITVGVREDQKGYDGVNVHIIAGMVTGIVEGRAAKVAERDPVSTDLTLRSVPPGIAACMRKNVNKMDLGPTMEILGSAGCFCTSMGVPIL